MPPALDRDQLARTLSINPKYLNRDANWLPDSELAEVARKSRLIQNFGRACNVLGITGIVAIMSVIGCMEFGQQLDVLKPANRFLSSKIVDAPIPLDVHGKPSAVGGPIYAGQAIAFGSFMLVALALGGINFTTARKRDYRAQVHVGNNPQQLALI